MPRFVAVLTGWLLIASSSWSAEPASGLAGLLGHEIIGPQLAQAQVQDYTEAPRPPYAEGHHTRRVAALRRAHAPGNA